MHDDDEDRFPRITLWQFLAGIFGPILDFWLRGVIAFFPPDPGEEADRRKKRDGCAT